MATRKKDAAGIAPAAAPQATTLATSTAAPIVLPSGATTGEIEVALEAAKQPGQIASALAAPVLDTGAVQGGVVSEPVVLDDGYPQDIEMSARTVMVQSRAARGRWRIGRHFTTEPSAVVVDELTEDELGRLLADPELIVSLDD